MKTYHPPSKSTFEDMVFRLGVALLILCLGLALPWMISVPREPGGSICRQSSPLTSFWAFMRGQIEVGCESEFGPIIEKPLSLWTYQKPG